MKGHDLTLPALVDALRRRGRRATWYAVSRGMLEAPGAMLDPVALELAQFNVARGAKKAGHFVFGPRVRMGPGQFICHAWLRFSPDEAASRLVIDAVGWSGGTVTELGSTAVSVRRGPGRMVVLALAFKVPSELEVELRLWTDGHAGGEVEHLSCFRWRGAATPDSAQPPRDLLGGRGEGRGGLGLALPLDRRGPPRLQLALRIDHAVQRVEVLTRLDRLPVDGPGRVLLALPVPDVVVDLADNLEMSGWQGGRPLAPMDVQGPEAEGVAQGLFAGGKAHADASRGAGEALDLGPALSQNPAPAVLLTGARPFAFQVRVGAAPELDAVTAALRLAEENGPRANGPGEHLQVIAIGRRSKSAHSTEVNILKVWSDFPCKVHDIATIEAHGNIRRREHDLTIWAGHAVVPKTPRMAILLKRHAWAGIGVFEFDDVFDVVDLYSESEAFLLYTPGAGSRIVSQETVPCLDVEGSVHPFLLGYFERLRPPWLAAGYDEARTRLGEESRGGGTAEPAGKHPLARRASEGHGVRHEQQA